VKIEAKRKYPANKLDNGGDVIFSMTYLQNLHTKLFTIFKELPIQLELAIFRTLTDLLKIAFSEEIK